MTLIIPFTVYSVSDIDNTFSVGQYTITTKPFSVCSRCPWKETGLLEDVSLALFLGVFQVSVEGDRTAAHHIFLQ
jgi:hypothetical protein